MSTSAPIAVANAVVSSPMVPGPQTRIRFPDRPGRRRRPASRCRPARPGHRTRSSMASGSRYRLDARTRTCSASAPGQSTMPTSWRLAQTCPRPAAHRGQLPAAEHGVPGHPGAQPAGIHLVADSGHHAAPLVTWADREADLALGEVGQLPGEQLDVGSADPGPADVDHDLPVPGTGTSTSSTRADPAPVITSARIHQGSHHARPCCIPRSQHCGSLYP
jgi:hypothetical protein